MRNISQLMWLSVAAAFSLFMSGAQGYSCVSGSLGSRSSSLAASATATTMNLSRPYGEQQQQQQQQQQHHRYSISARREARSMGLGEGGWVVGKGVGWAWGQTSAATFNQAPPLGMAAESGAPPAKKKRKGKGPYKVIADNKKARRNYEILEKFEAGIELVGSEVKSCRMSKLNMDEGFAQAKNGQCLLHGVHIAECGASNRFYQHEPRRPRRLLLHKREIKKLEDKVAQKGMTVVPLKMFFNDDNRLKVEIGLALGKNVRDKREDIKDREAKRDMQRIAKSAFD